jgi:hypothetical protein
MNTRDTKPKTEQRGPPSGIGPVPTVGARQPDTWVASHISGGSLSSEAARAHEAEIMELHRQLGQLTGQFEVLTGQLRAAHAGSDAELALASQRDTQLFEQEQQLAKQGERIRELERELANDRIRLAAFQSGAVGAGDPRLHRELDELRRRVAAQAEALQRRESRRQVYESQLREREAWLDERDAVIEQLGDELQTLHPDYRSPAEARAAPAAGPARAPAAPPARSPAAIIAEVRIAALASELDALHARAAAGAAPPGVPGNGENAASGEGMEAELASLRRANEQLLARLGDRNARHVDSVSPRDTGSFAATDEFSAGNGSGSYVLSDGQLRMLVRTEGDTGIVHVLGRRTTIGRTPDNELCIDSDSVSRHHAVALQTSHGTVIEDLNSTNGVYINGQRVARRPLAEGDVLTIGMASFRYLVKPAAEAANS